MTALHITVTGVNHRTAPVEVRETAALDPAVVARLAREAGIDEVIAISTCNRAEIYTVSSSEGAADTLADQIFATEQRYRYVHRGARAVEHLLRVAAGIDSLLVGETEILGQVRRAFETAQQAGDAGRVLSALFRQALLAGKRARAETAISQHPVSAAGAAVQVARRHHGRLEGRTVLLIGTGAVAKKIVPVLRGERIARLIVASRSELRAADLAASASTSVPVTEAISTDGIAAALQRCDVAIAASSSQEFLVSVDAVCAAANATRKLVLIDLGVPRNIDPRARQISGAAYFDVDDLNGVSDANREQRQNEIQRVEEIVREEVESFLEWYRSLVVHPTIADLRSKAETIRAAEVQRALRRLSALTEKDQEVVEILTQSIVQKLLHDPTIRLKEHAAAGGGPALANALRDLFALEKHS